MASGSEIQVCSHCSRVTVIGVTSAMSSKACLPMTSYATGHRSGRCPTETIRMPSGTATSAASSSRPGGPARPAGRTPGTRTARRRRASPDRRHTRPPRSDRPAWPRVRGGRATVRSRTRVAGTPGGTRGIEEDGTRESPTARPRPSRRPDRRPGPAPVPVSRRTNWIASVPQWPRSRSAPRPCRPHATRSGPRRTRPAGSPPRRPPQSAQLDPGDITPSRRSTSHFPCSRAEASTTAVGVGHPFVVDVGSALGDRAARLVHARRPAPPP